MSIQYMENFSIYGIGVSGAAELIKGTPWTLAPNDQPFPDPDGVSTTRALRLTSNSATQCRAVLPVATDVTYVAYRLWMDQLPTEIIRAPSLELRDSNNNIRYILRTNPVGGLTFLRVVGNYVVMTGPAITDAITVGTVPNVLSDGMWQHIEHFLNRTTGEFSVKVEGVTVLTGTDAAPNTGDTGNVSFRSFFFGGSGSSTAVFIKDVVLADDAGSVNNAGIGTVQVITLRPNADVSSGWTRSSGSVDFSLVDELVPNDSGFIQAEDDPLPAASIMELTNLPPDIVAVRALQTMVRCLKSDGGDATLVASLVSNAIDDNGASHAVSTSVGYRWDVSELDPDGGVAWTPVKVDLARIKIDRTV